MNGEGFKFINFDDAAQWTAEFESDSAKIQATWGTEIKDGETLKTKCGKVMSSDSEKNKEDIENVKKWCGIRSISSQLERKGKKFLVNSKEDAGTLTGKWTATYNKRKENQTSRATLGLSGTWPSTDQNEIERVKALCREKGNSDFLVKDNVIYTAIENWCTEEGAKVDVRP
ncbi:hypothetical protein A6V39_05050 [Candidatus Mycoplasma haematobovis]|uniref:Uncharacterized protein n=1 Tax=Candidatus Mycoplasma haematobovis TaxID=432608 RepID=A0A1A9QCW6_9MOLU|nr:hypothetical protein [Candidatus Mycoplasma haematobovis]OAL09795.1 hypothetical protein A6V39_05050 [Candidatus Mycoplasma haematobovis]